VEVVAAGPGVDVVDRVVDRLPQAPLPDLRFRGQVGDVEAGVAPEVERPRRRGLAAPWRRGGPVVLAGVRRLARRLARLAARLPDGSAGRLVGLGDRDLPGAGPAAPAGRPLARGALRRAPLHHVRLEVLTAQVAPGGDDDGVDARAGLGGAERDDVLARLELGHGDGGPRVLAHRRRPDLLERAVEADVEGPALLRGALHARPAQVAGRGRRPEGGGGVLGRRRGRAGALGRDQRPALRGAVVFRDDEAVADDGRGLGLEGLEAGRAGGAGGAGVGTAGGEQEGEGRRQGRESGGAQPRLRGTRARYAPSG